MKKKKSKQIFKIQKSLVIKNNQKLITSITHLWMLWKKDFNLKNKKEQISLKLNNNNKEVISLITFQIKENNQKYPI